MKNALSVDKTYITAKMFQKLINVFFLLILFLSSKSFAQVQNPYINLAPDVSGEMLNCEYWLKKIRHPDKLLMSTEDIALWNENCISTVVTELENFYLVCDLRNVDSLLSGSDIRRTMVSYNPNKPWFKKTKQKGTETIHKLVDSDWASFWKEMNLEELVPYNEWINQQWVTMKANKKDFPVRKAVCLRRSNLRAIPEDNFYSDDENFWYDDIAQNSGILMNEPVLVLWQNVEKTWFYVKSSTSTGWIKSSNIAFCSDEEFDRYFDYAKKPSDSFVTITKERIKLSDDYFVPKAKNKPEFFMGTYIHVIPWTEELANSFSPRTPFASYLAEIPYRKGNGELGITYCALPASLCVSGFMPYTSRNLLTLAFEMVGMRYGWGGMAGARDCSEYLRDVYRCFGFIFPRNSRSQMCMPGKTYELTGKSASKKTKVLDQLECGAFLAFAGHVFMYLGKTNGRHYAISALGSYYPDGKNYEQRIDACSVNINTLDVVKKDGKNWLDWLSVAKTMQGTEELFQPLVKHNTATARLYRTTSRRKNQVVAVDVNDSTQKANIRAAKYIKEELLRKGYDVLMLAEYQNEAVKTEDKEKLIKKHAQKHVLVNFSDASQLVQGADIKKKAETIMNASLRKK